MRKYYTPTGRFMSDLVFGVLKRDTLPNHGELYSGEREQLDCERFSNFVASSEGKKMYDMLGEPYVPC